MKSLISLSLLAVPMTVYAALDAGMKAKGKKYFGTALDPNTINDSAVNAAARADFGCYTPENSAKWESIHPSNSTYNWGNFDTLVNFAQTNGKAIRGHTLLWHAQLPQYVKDITSVSVLTATIQAHVAAVVGRYKGKILHWDVANEVVDDSGKLRSSVFSNVFGGDTFLDVVFKAARAADPDAKLYLNDYNLDYSGAKLTYFIALVKRLQARGVPIDGIGTQAHLGAGNVGSFTSAFNQLIAVGLDVAITELDIGITKPVTSAGLSQQQADYNTVTKACMAQPKCVGITVWGVSDKYSWRGADTAPLLFNESVQKKPAYTGVESAIGAGTNTTTTTTTTTTTSGGGNGCTVAKWGQCGGSGYTGCTTCASGSVCTYSNPYYSQCL